MITPRRLQELYRQGRNISALLREDRGAGQNTPEIIEMAYDLQTGSYVEGMQDEEMARHKAEYAAEISAVILSLCRPESVMEAGVGEATTLSGVLRNIGGRVSSYGFDLSWSRVAYARRWLGGQGLEGTVLCTGDLLRIPFADSSVDVVYTSHSIEPNGGAEEPILRELHRVARKYLVLLEPGYELASEDARRRMEQHGYCRNLKGTAESLGYRVREHRLFPVAVNPLNPTALTVICKEADSEPPDEVLACPRFRTPLRKIGGMLFSPEALTVYPIVGGIPCLRVENGILASKYEEVVRGDG